MRWWVWLYLTISFFNEKYHDNDDDDGGGGCGGYDNNDDDCTDEICDAHFNSLS